MGFLLKEALKTLCGRNQWSYAVFWKIGCNNSKLLIWEECYYEPLPCSFPQPNFGNGEGSWFSSESHSSQMGIQEEDRVCSLINKMTVNNSVNIAGEGIIGRAAFTGNHQWILFNNFSRDAYPPEVYAEMHHQLSAGMQTVAVIPVLPHGVVQLGSFLPIMENIGFVNDVKSLILQLGCIPGALLSEDYSGSPSIGRALATGGLPVSVKPPAIPSHCIPSVSNGSNEQSNPSHVSRPTVQTHCPIRGEMNNFQGSVLTPKTNNLSQISNGYCQPNATTLIKTNFAGQSENRVVEAEVIPSSRGSCLQQPSVSYNARSAFNGLSSFGQSVPSDCNLKYMEQQMMSVLGNQGHSNPSINASSTLNMSLLKTDGGHILDHNQSSSSASLLAGIPIHGGVSSLLRTSLVTDSGLRTPDVSVGDLSGAQGGGVGVKSDGSSEAGGCSLANFFSHSGSFTVPTEGSDQKLLSVDVKDVHDALPSKPVTTGGQSPDFVQDCVNKHVTGRSMVKNVKQEQVCAQPSSGDDLFDILGADFKNQLLSGNWDKLFAVGSESNTENMDKKPTCMNMQGMNSDYYSASEAISESDIFSGTGTDHLLDAVVSKTKSVMKQNSDDMSCRTTLTSSTCSVPSRAYKPAMPDHIQGGMFGIPKSEGKTGAVENSMRSGCIKDDGGKCSQTSSMFGSQLSSWVENSSKLKLENSVSTGYSKRPDEVCKSNRKRLKPGENPRPRPKDRQMIQDRVKELREIVPNGAKCSIDALLERTIKHMLFLQSVTKHADKLKQTGDSKIISKEGGLLLKDNFEGGATWAYEVGSQSMVCPIIVEDLNHPRQMLVEMLCEERGFFLEIADLIRGLGLTILKGVMEARNDKIWARFAVEANRDITRMEIFMSLVRLLDQTVKGNVSSSNAGDKNMMAYQSFPQATQIPATGRPSSLQ
ncbi:transcription factor LHW-like [Arachis stenosperma]|uniref:transcription factor LHW-like n=1 Tax=Arachis stenosperma TaxID=217475 RepID=UPI0025AD75C3|nr:transcription factor LHW-like [Arachis stenosperma]